MLAGGGRERHREAVVGIAREVESLDGDERVVISPAVQDREWVGQRRGVEDFFIRDVDRDKVVLVGAP